MNSTKRPSHLFVTSGYPPNRGIFTHRTIQQLQALVQTTVILLSTPKNPLALLSSRYQLEGIPVRIIPVSFFPGMTTRPWAALFSAIITYPMVRCYLNKSEVIEAGDLYFTGALVSKWCRIGGFESKAMVANMTGDDINLYLKAFFKQDPSFVRDLLQSYDVIMSRSRALMDTARIWGALPPKLVLAPRGVDTRMFSPEGPKIEIFPANGPIRFLYLGGFPDGGFSIVGARDVKGGLLLLQAWIMAEPDLGCARLAICGPGTDTAHLSRWRDSLLHPEAVHIQTGEIPADDIPGLMRGFDCIVVPSRSEGLPNVVNEAQASKLGIIASDAGGIPEAVDPGMTAKLFPAEDAGALAKELVWCASHPIELHQMGCMGRKRVESLFSWEVFLERASMAYGIAWRDKYGSHFPMQDIRKIALD